jgi:hypothetical protein
VRCPEHRRHGHGEDEESSSASHGDEVITVDLECLPID